MNIGVDLDGVVFRTDLLLIDRVNKIFGLNLNYYDITAYNMFDSYVSDKKILKKIISKVISMPRLPLSENVQFILDLLSKKHNIYFITSRYKENRNSTISQLLDLDIYDYELYMTDGEETKSRYINELGIDIFVEDNIKHVEEIYNNTDCKILIMDRPWNKGKETNERIDRVFGWLQVYSVVENY